MKEDGDRDGAGAEGAESVDGIGGALSRAFSDPAVRATAASRIIALVGAPVTMYLAATRLPPVTQGYFVVAVNVVALAQLFELGLGTIVVQFVSHEWPRLRWGRDGGLDGDPFARDAVASVQLAALRWFGLAALVVYVIAGIAGAGVFGARAAGPRFDFTVMWLGATALGALYLAFIPFICVAEGCGDLLSVQRMRATQAAAVLVGLWTGITLNNALMAAWLAAAAQLTVAGIWLVQRHRGLLRAPRSLPAQLMGAARGVPMRYRTEQRRSALLWLSLHLAPQLLAPIVLALRGGDDAGRLGMTMAIALAPATLSVGWLHSRYPAFGALAAEGKIGELDALARRATREAVGVFMAAALFLTSLVALLPRVLPEMAARLLPVVALLALFAGSLASVVQQAMAAWLRSFRDERIATAVVPGAAATIVASAIGAAVGGVPLLVASYAVSSLLIATPMVAARFARERARLRRESPGS